MNVGYEVSFSNAAFIINRKISLEQGSPSFSTAVYMALMNPNKPTASVVSQDLRPLLARLQTRAYLESAAQGNRDSMLSVGHAFHEGIGICADQREAMRWYTRASSKAHALGSFYVATMYHFGLKIEADVPKAIKYYEYALNQGDLQPAFRTIARALLYTAKSRFGSFFFPAPSQGIERIVKYCLTWT
jgi:TPR repeat protein